MNGKKYEIKPLEWVEEFSKSEQESHLAKTHKGDYRVGRDNDGCYMTLDWRMRKVPSIADGKSLAERDWLAKAEQFLTEVKE